jgi:hypothetical protein
VSLDASWGIPHPNMYLLKHTRALQIGKRAHHKETTVSKLMRSPLMQMKIMQLMGRNLKQS